MNAHDHESVNLTVETLLNERHSIKTGSTRQPTGRGLWLGPFRGTRRGQGTDFDDLRHYSAGDDIRHIDWKASARTNSIHTRLYREEREFQITLIVDFRDAMFAGSTQLQAVRVGRLAARLLWQAADGGCKAQILIATDEGIRLGKSGTSHQSAIDSCALIARAYKETKLRHSDTDLKHADTSDELLIDAVSDSIIPLPPSERDAPQTGVNLDQVAEWLLQRTEKSKNIFWLSPFNRCGRQFKKHLYLLSMRGNQIAITVDDELINTGLPVGRYGYKDPDDTSIRANRSKTTRLALLGKRDSERVIETLLAIKRQRQILLEESMMSIVGADEGNNQVVSSLRHHGFLP